MQGGALALSREVTADASRSVFEYNRVSNNVGGALYVTGAHSSFRGSDVQFLFNAAALESGQVDFAFYL